MGRCACAGDEDLELPSRHHSKGWYLSLAVTMRYPIVLSTVGAGRIRVSALVPPRTSRGAKAMGFPGTPPTSDVDAAQDKEEVEEDGAEQRHHAPTSPLGWS